MRATGEGWLWRGSGHPPYRRCLTRWACPASSALVWRRQWSAEHACTDRHSEVLTQPARNGKGSGALPTAEAGGLRAEGRRQLEVMVIILAELAISMS